MFNALASSEVQDPRSQKQAPMTFAHDRFGFIEGLMGSGPVQKSAVV